MYICIYIYIYFNNDIVYMYMRLSRAVESSRIYYTILVYTILC